MNRQTPYKNPLKEDKIVDGVAEEPKTYDGKYDPVELEEYIRGIKKIFTIIEAQK